MYFGFSLSWACRLSFGLFVKFSVMKLTGLLVCSCFMELPFCKHMCVWITWICRLHYVFFPILVSIAPAKRAAPCLHSSVGCQHIYFQYSLFMPELGSRRGKFNSSDCLFSWGLLFPFVKNLTHTSFFLVLNCISRRQRFGKWLGCGIILFLASLSLLSSVLEF